MSKKKETLYHSSSISPNSYPFHLHLLSTIISLAGFLILRNKFEACLKKLEKLNKGQKMLKKGGQLVEDS
jgi:hypothetical protein